MAQPHQGAPLKPPRRAGNTVPLPKHPRGVGKRVHPPHPARQTREDRLRPPDKRGPTDRIVRVGLIKVEARTRGVAAVGVLPRACRMRQNFDSPGDPRRQLPWVEARRNSGGLGRQSRRADDAPPSFPATNL